jgi:hypothetical protein
VAQDFQWWVFNLIEHPNILCFVDVLLTIHTFGNPAIAGLLRRMVMFHSMSRFSIDDVLSNPLIPNAAHRTSDLPEFSEPLPREGWIIELHSKCQRPFT